LTRKATHNNHIGAQYRLGNIYETGMANIGLKNAYFAVEEIVDKHVMELSGANETSPERYHKGLEEEKVS
jgi:TPR repeat protein